MLHFFQRFVLLLGLLLLVMGYAGFILLTDLSRQYFRQDVSPWQAFSIGLMAAGLSLLVAWFFLRIISLFSDGSVGKQPNKPPSDNEY